jgi:hypothetical protein
MPGQIEKLLDPIGESIPPSWNPLRKNHSRADEFPRVLPPERRGRFFRACKPDKDVYHARLDEAFQMLDNIRTMA